MNRTGDNWKIDTYARLIGEAKAYAASANSERKNYTDFKKTHGPHSAGAVHAYMNWRDLRLIARERRAEAEAFKKEHGV